MQPKPNWLLAHFVIAPLKLVHPASSQHVA